MKRREFLAMSVAGAALQVRGSGLDGLRNSPFHIVADDGADHAQLALDRKWSGDVCRSRLINRGARPARVREIVLFDVAHNFPGDTHLYGESFQMLSQTGGTLSNPENLGYDELKHYKIPQPEGATALTGLVTLRAPSANATTALAFTSCKRFNGRFYLRPGRIQVVLDCERIEIAPGAAWELEEFYFATGDRKDLLDRIATAIARNHATKMFSPEPAGWCSWYCFGPRVTAQNVLDNLDTIEKRIPGLRYVQIDDGYQAAMGDWLLTGKAFGGDILGVLKEIRRRGFEPAIWVAPFVAEADSQIFRAHSDWFVKDVAGKPLPSNTVSFGGWRKGPWYALDGTHPEAQKHLENLFRTMRTEWGCTYFKLDANFWGALHGGHRYDPRATRIQAYRRGMEAIRRGSGKAFVLGCNHPMWASTGLIDGSRASEDIKRTWPKVRAVARQTLMRNWQNGRLWWNDPDAIVLTGDLPLNEFLFHATACYASGGMALSGDDLSSMPADRMAILRKLVPAGGIAAEFEDDSLRVGRIVSPGAQRVCVFNWGESLETIAIRLPKKARVTDFWSGEDLGVYEHEFKMENLASHCARLITIT
jgi:alpha-galactosidase